MVASPARGASGLVGRAQGYAEVREIGRGSFGTARLARDREGRECVMKIVDISAADSKQRQEAINEATILASLKHPYIVRYYDSFIEDGQLAIIMDYAEGGDLHDLISSRREAQSHFQEARVLRWLTEAALALKYMHDRQIIHRDLKSQNLLLNGKGDLRVADFGVAKVLRKPRCGGDMGRGDYVDRATIGSPGYLSPEIFTRTLYSFSSDVWSLGCILYEVASLRMPFEAWSLPGLVLKVTHGPTPALPQPYSEGLRQLGLEMLSHDRELRPSAAHMARRPLLRAEMRQMLREGRAITCQKQRGPSPQPRAGSRHSTSGKERQQSPSLLLASVDELDDLPWARSMSEEAIPRQLFRTASEVFAAQPAVAQGGLGRPPNRELVRSPLSQTLLRSGAAALLPAPPAARPEAKRSSDEALPPLLLTRCRSVAHSLDDKSRSCGSSPGSCTSPAYFGYKSCAQL